VQHLRCVAYAGEKGISTINSGKFDKGFPLFIFDNDPPRIPLPEDLLHERNHIVPRHLEFFRAYSTSLSQTPTLWITFGFLSGLVYNKKMLTFRQKQILDFITERVSKQGVAPTHREIARHFRLSSVGTIHEHLGEIQKKGYLEKRRGQARAMLPRNQDAHSLYTSLPKRATANHATGNTSEGTETSKHMTLPVNKILCGDAVETLRMLPSNSIDVVVTSPPYDDIRTYNGFSLDLPAVGRELHRVLKEGGIAAMVIQDATRNFGKTLTSFKTIVDWCDNAGFKLFETVIYRKHGTEGAWWKNRFRVDHEYMPIFLKGDRPRYFNKEPLKIPSKHGGKVLTGSGNRRTDGTTTKTVTRPINLTKCRGTVWDYLMAGDKDPLKRKHPAVFPDKIPHDFIQCFCPPRGVVLDPFGGCGSTAVAAKRLGRDYIIIDIAKEYCDLAERRLQTVAPSLF